MPREIPKAYEPQEIEAALGEGLVRREAIPRGKFGNGPDVFDCAAAAEHHRLDSHRAHARAHADRHAGALAPHARASHAVAAGHGPRRHRDAVRRGAATGEGKIRRQDLGREEFERRVWKWKAESGGVIKQQMIRLGASCDWTREKFTLEPALYRAVLEAFLRLYREGLIYRGRYMVNWCPRCQTAISDLEVVHNERPGKLWHIRYPIVGAAAEQ